MKIRQPGASRAPSSKRTISCRSSSSSSSRRTRSRSSPRAFVDQIGLPAHDQHRAPALVLAPGREPRGDQLAAAWSNASLRWRDLLRSIALRLAQRHARQARIDEIGDLAGALRRRSRGRAARHGSRRCRRSPTSTASARPGSSATKLSCLRRISRFGAMHHARRTDDRPGQRRGGRGERLLDRLVAVDLAPRSPRARAHRAASLHDAVDEQPQPGLGRHRPG